MDRILVQRTTLSKLGIIIMASYTSFGTLKYLLSLLLLVRLILADYNINFIESVLTRSRAYHNFSNMPIFVGRNVKPIELKQLSRFLSVDMKVAQYIFESTANDTLWQPLRHHINADALNIILCDSSEDSIWKIVDRRLRNLRQTKMLIAFEDHEEQEEGERATKVELLFALLWRLQFIQVILLSNSSIYRYTPYPIISISLIGNSSENLFPHLGRDLKGYTVSTPVENDIPRVFCVNDFSGQLHVKGFAYQLFTEFLRRLNAKLHITNPYVNRSINSNVNMSNILQQISKHELEITLHPYSGIPESIGVLSYPMFTLQNCLIIPVRNEIPRYMYLLRPFEWRSWSLIVVAILYVAFILVLVSPKLQLIATPFHERLSRGFLESIALVLFLASTFRIYAPRPRYFIVYLQLAILGFFITTWYLNLLSSFLTTFLVGDQVNTFEDLIAASFPILAKEYEVYLLLEQVPAHLVRKVERLIVPVNASVQMSHLLSFNTTYSYPVTEERWTFLALQQQYANKPIHRYSQICFGTPRVGYPMRMDSHFEHLMMTFILDVQMAGLDHYWLVADFKDALEAGYVHLIDNVLTIKALDLDSLRVAWYVVGIGWLLSVIVFLNEIWLCSNGIEQYEP